MNIRVLALDIYIYERKFMWKLDQYPQKFCYGGGWTN